MILLPCVFPVIFQIAQNISSVRGVFKILAPRQSLPDNLEDLSMCPEDEFTLFFYIGGKLYLLKFPVMICILEFLFKLSHVYSNLFI